MKPIVYAYHDQVNALFQSNNGQHFKGVAFGWHNENVYHVFTDIPKVAPTGYPLPCLIQFLGNDDFLEAENNIIAKSKELLNIEENGKLPPKIIIILFFTLKNNVLKKILFPNR